MLQIVLGGFKGACLEQFKNCLRCEGKLAVEWKNRHCSTLSGLSIKHKLLKKHNFAGISKEKNFIRQKYGVYTINRKESIFWPGANERLGNLALCTISVKK